MDLIFKSYKEMLSKLQSKDTMEEKMSQILRRIEKEFTFQSTGIFIKNTKTETYKLKNSRNISHLYEKKAEFSKEDEIIHKLSNIDIIEFTSEDEFKFEKSYSHLLISPLYYGDHLLGFLFIDRVSGMYDENAINKFTLFASLLSFIIELYLKEHKLHELEELDKKTNLLCYRTFVERSSILFAQARRYDRHLTLVVLKIDHFSELFRTIGNTAASDAILQVAGIINAGVRNSELVSSIYPDTFAILLTETSVQNANYVIQRLQAKIKEISNMQSTHLSWGVVPYDKSLSSMEKFIKIGEECAFESSRRTVQNITTYEELNHLKS